MLDTMTLTKTVGALCGTLLIFLLVKWGGELLYHPGKGHGDHHEQAYTIPTGDEEAGETEVADAGPTFEEAFQMASADAGERLFRACQACHKLEDGANGTGPHLYGIVGRAVDAVDGFNYSGALEAVADVWTPENLNLFIENPRGFAPGTKMSYNGMADIEDRANLIAYLQSIGG